MTRMPAHWLVFRSTLPLRATALEEKDHEINAHDRSANLPFHYCSHRTELHSKVLPATAAADHSTQREIVLPAASSADDSAECEVVLFAAASSHDSSGWQRPLGIIGPSLKYEAAL
jgi:hypothetical protein